MFTRRSSLSSFISDVESGYTELLKRLSVGGLYCLGYADDFVIIAREKFESTLCDFLQEGINITIYGAIYIGVSVNPAKTTLVPFTRRSQTWQSELSG